MKKLRPIVSWISQSQLRATYTYDYWNDIDKEKTKAWWIENGTYDKCIQYLKSSGLMDAYCQSEKYVMDNNFDSIKVVDLAAGIGWTSALLSRLNNVLEVHAVEMSRHRLDKLFEHSIEMLQGDAAKIFRYLGSFYNLDFKDQSVDLIYLSQAFHHADKPLKLFTECDRVLKKNGRIVLVGEHRKEAKTILIKRFADLIKRGRFKFDFF